jgi:hypothetical protein
MRGWTSHSEIAHYTGDHPEGPFRFADVAIGANPGAPWNNSIHNPAYFYGPSGINLDGDDHTVSYVMKIALDRPDLSAESPAADAAGRWPAAKANQWYDAQPWPCGFNYVPAHAISSNQD